MSRDKNLWVFNGAGCWSQENRWVGMVWRRVINMDSGKYQHLMSTWKKQTKRLRRSAQSNKLNIRSQSYPQSHTSLLRHVHLDVSKSVSPIQLIIIHPTCLSSFILNHNPYHVDGMSAKHPCDRWHVMHVCDIYTGQPNQISGNHPPTIFLYLHAPNWSPHPVSSSLIWLKSILSTLFQPWFQVPPSLKQTTTIISQLISLHPIWAPSNPTSTGT